MHVTTCILFLRMIDERVHVALHRPIATRGVRIESAPRLDRAVGRFLHCLDGKVPRRLNHAPSLAADPRADGGPILVVMAAPGLTFLAAPPWRAAQGLFPTLPGLALVASGMLQVVGFDRPCPLPPHLIRQGGIAQPPTPAIARPHLPPHLSGNAARGTRQAQQKGGEHPVHERALAAVHERSREVIEGPLAVLFFTAVAQFIRLCSTSNLAEARCISSPWQGASPAKTRAASRPSRAHGYHLRPSTNCYKLSVSG
jgi:hypothetical protein